MTENEISPQIIAEIEKLKELEESQNNNYKTPIISFFEANKSLTDKYVIYQKFMELQ